MPTTHTSGRPISFNAAIAMDPSLGDPYVNLGAMLIKKGQHEDALVQINKGIDLGMAFPHIGYYDRAVAEQMLGRFKEAYYDYKKVLELEPNNQEALVMRVGARSEKYMQAIAQSTNPPAAAGRRR